MNNIELYIQNTEGDYLAIDLFDNENIQIEDSIQNVKDISKIFNTFTRDFKVPASFENNKLFKHYYNLNIDNGFDGRIKTRALIKVGGVDYKEGYLRLISVGMNNNQASHYKVSFQGLIASLKDVLGDDEIKDLDYSNLLFENTRLQKVNGIRLGLYRNGVAEQDANGDDLYPDVIYAPIFTSGKVVAVPWYDLNDTNDDLPTDDYSFGFSLTNFTGLGDTNTIKPGTEGTNAMQHVPVQLEDYKPSVKVGLLIKMISEQYDLRFTKEFYQLEELDQLYVHYNGVKEESSMDDSANAFNANLGNSTSLDTATVNIVEYTTEANPPAGILSLSGVDDMDRKVSISHTELGWQKAYYSRGYLEYWWNYNSEGSIPPLTITHQKFVRKADGSKQVLFETVTNQNQAGSAAQGTAGFGTGSSSQGLFQQWANDQAQFALDTEEGDVIEYSIQVQSNDSINELELQFTYQDTNDLTVIGNVINPNYRNRPNPPQVTYIVNSAYINIAIKAPKLKSIDLLLGVFKMLNLTSYVDQDGTIRVLPLREYYNEGRNINITQYVDQDSHQVENGFVYRNVTMKHEQPEDVLSKNFATTEVGVEYGDIRVNKENFFSGEELQGADGIADGKDYKIESPFARMMFENLALAVDDDNNQTGGIYSTSVGGLPTDMVIGNCIDDTLEGIETKPIIFYGKQVVQWASYQPNPANPTSIDDIGGRIITNTRTERGNMAGAIGSAALGRWFVLVEEGATSSNSKHYVQDQVLRDDEGTDNTLGYYYSGMWWNPSGIMASRYRRDRVTLMNPYGYFNSISFDGSQAYDEFEYNNGLASDQWIVGLYQNNYEDYLKNLYERNSRISKFKVQLPNDIITSYSLNDTLIVGTNEYNINKIKVDLLSGKGEVELINKIEIPVVELGENLGEIVRDQITGLNLLPASGNYIYNTSVVTKTFPPEEVGGDDTVINVNTYNGDDTKADAEVALDRIQEEFPNIESLSVIMTWYGDTDGPDMVIKPRLDLDDDNPTYNVPYTVGSYDRTNTPEVTLTAEGKANQGGTPGDAGVLEFVQECNSRGIKVMLYPFLQMDTVDKGWRGMIPFTSKSDIDTWWLQYEPFIRHYSQLFAASSVTLDKFMIGTELVTFTRYNDNGQYYGVQHLAQLAEDVRNDFGASNAVQISYGANWDEYHSHDENYHMDELWTSPYIDAVGIDNYFPATDFQDPQTVTYQDIYDGYEKGEGWDHYYGVYSDDPATMLASKVDYPVAGGEFAWKNCFGWWDRNHTAHSYTTAGNPTLGSELLTSADFSSIAYPWNYGSWSYIPTPTVNAGIATLTIGGGDYPAVNPRIEQDFATVSGETYTVEVDVNYAGSVPIQVLTVDPNNGYAYLNGDTQTFASNGIITFDFTATSAGTTVQILVQGLDGDSVDLNSASVKQQVAGSGTTVTNTAWTARMKPLFFAEYGFASVDGTSNQPNVFSPALPRLSNGNTDYNAQRIGLRAFNDYWDAKTEGISGFAEDRYAWAYDLRPFPQYPNAGIWDDSDAWEKGHWLNGKLV